MEKKLFIVLGLAAILACPAMAATTLKVTMGYDSSVSYPYSPYTVTIGAGDWSPYGYVAGDVFDTFCVERYDEFSATTYWATVDDVVKYPDDYTGTNWDNQNQSTTDALNVNTQKIYAAYLADQYQSSSYTANALQAEIWYQQGFGGTSIAGILQIANDYASISDSYKNVKVLNLWLNSAATGEYDIQSHLIMVPAPGAIMLASMGMGLVGWLRRRQAL